METIPDTKIVASFKKTALILSLFTVLIGILVEIGWQFDIDLLRNFSPDSIFMNPLTALNFILIGLAIQIIGYIKTGKFLWLAQIAGLFVILTGFLRLGAILFGFDTQIDQFLFGSKLLENRIAPNTAFCFIAIGAALFFLARNKYYKLIHILCFLTATLSYLAILGYFFSVKNLYGILALTPMALNTAIAFFMASLAILLVNPDKGFMRAFSTDSPGGKTARILLPAILIIPPALDRLILLAQDLGFINTRFGTTLSNLLLIVIFLGIIYGIVNFINKIDSARQQLEKGEYQTDEKLKSANDALDQELAQYQSQNKHLEDTEKAMLNILDDAKALGNELKVEKIGIEQKVTERTRELTEEKNKVQASINSLSMGFIMTDTKNNIVISNPALEKIFGFASKKQTLADISALLHESFNLTKQCQICIEGKKTIDVKDISFESKYLRIFITPMTTDKNEVIGTVILIDDITEAKMVERSKDEFFSIASHELRTPLTAIRGNTALILQFFADKLKDPQLKEMISDVNESSIRLIQIVNDFLDMSRLELGKIIFKKEMVDIVKIVKDVIKEYQTTGSLKMLYLKLEEPKEKIPVFVADPDRTKQIIINLIGNAIKYTEKGGATISIKTLGKFLKIRVVDTGKGISPESQKLLFRKFQQASENIYTRDATKGTGLGLYISRLMAEGMGGRLELERSVPGKGSIFTFILPIVGLQTAKNVSNHGAINSDPIDKDQVRESTK